MVAVKRNVRRLKSLQPSETTEVRTLVVDAQRGQVHRVTAALLDDLVHVVLVDVDVSKEHDQLAGLETTCSRRQLK